MWCLAFSIYLSVKWMTWWFCDQQARLGRTISYLVFWPGLNAKAFLSSQESSQPPTQIEWFKAWMRTALGLLCLWWLPTFGLLLSPTVAAWAGMFGVVLVLHFGTFDLMSCYWRSRGVRAERLMNHPLHSISLSEFWGKRWNTAFRDLSNEFLFQPLSKRFSPYGALLVVFLFSGIVHDLVVSVPAGGGYGWPTLYFIIQAIGMSVERSRLGKRIGLLRGMTGLAFTAAVILLPAPLLFHQPFLNNIVLPMLNDIGSLQAI